LKEEISTENAPAAVGPYSQGVKSNGFIFVSGKLPATPDGTLITDDPKAAARQALESIRAVLAAAGASMGDVLKVTIYLADMRYFVAVNEVYESFFSPPYPARACVEVKALPKGARVEIEAVAAKP